MNCSMPPGSTVPSEFRVYWKVVLPLSGPAFAAIGIFTFIYAWEDFCGR